MRLLLDTHILLGVVDAVGFPLRADIINALNRPQLTMFASVASLWEIDLKHRSGKLPLGTPLDRWSEALAGGGITLLDLTLAHLVGRVEPELTATKDPFDRLLLATAAAEGAQLVTVDRALIDHPLAWRP